MICCTVNNVIEFSGIDTCIYVWLHILLYTYLCVTRRVFEYHIWPSIRWNTKTSSSSCATVDGIVMADAQLNSMDFWGSCTGWQVVYNHLIGSIYGLYTRYILPSKGPHILATTYHQNQKNPYIKRSSFFRWDEAGRTIVLQIWIDPGDPCFDSVEKKTCTSWCRYPSIHRALYFLPNRRSWKWWFYRQKMPVFPRKKSVFWSWKAFPPGFKCRKISNIKKSDV